MAKNTYVLDTNIYLTNFTAIYSFKNNDIFITSDNPLVVERHSFGSIWLLPLDRRHLYLFGYYIGQDNLNQLEQYINNCYINPENINSQIRQQANTFVIL